MHERIIVDEEGDQTPDGEAHLEIDGRLVPVDLYTLSAARDLPPPVIVFEEGDGLAAILPDGYKLPDNPKIREEVIFVPDDLAPILTNVEKF